MRFRGGYLALLPFLISFCGLPVSDESKTDLLPAEQRFIDNLDGTITDKSLKLVWKKCVQNDIFDSTNNRCTGNIDSSIYEFRYCNVQDNSCNGGVTGQVLSAGGNSEAFNSCDALNAGAGFAGRTNWRVARALELKALIPEPVAFFNNAPDNNRFVSADSSSGVPQDSIFIVSVVGSLGESAKTGKGYLRCVSSLP